MNSTFDTIFERIGLSLESVAVLLLAAALGFLLAIVIAFLVRRAAGFEKTRPVAAMAARCAAPLRALLPVVGMSIALSGLDASSGVAALLPLVFSVLTIALAGWFAVRAVRGLIDYFVAAHSIDHADNLEARRMQTQIRLLGRVLIIVISITTVAGVLVSIPGIRNIGVSLFASAGIAGLAIGLAARPALSNLIAGIQIALTQPIRLEDAVVVEGEWGWIEEINMTFVVVRIWDLRRLVLPISYFIEKPFQNWTRTTADILG
jgi:small-conductance mechanosensitive channel